MTTTEDLELPLVQDLPHLVERLERRYPLAHSALIWRCVDDAANWFGQARVRLYLPVLIERRANEAIRAALTSGLEPTHGTPIVAAEATTFADHSAPSPCAAFARTSHPTEPTATVTR